MDALNDVPPLDDWYSIEDLVAAFPKVLTDAKLRWQIRHRAENGLASACYNQGVRGKMFISKSRYERWLASQAGAV